MTSPDMDDEAVKAMARRIVADTIYHKPGRDFDDARAKVLNGDWDTFDHVRAALAAIIETQELIAQFVGAHSRHADPADIARAIRSGQQFRKDV